MAFFTKLSNSTKVIVIFGFIVLATALLAPYLGLGERKNFIIYRLTGIQRREVAYIGVILVFVGLFADVIRGLCHRFDVRLRKSILFAPAIYGRLRTSFRDHLIPSALHKIRVGMATPWSVERLQQFFRRQAPLCFTIAASLYFFLAMWALSGNASNLTEGWVKEIIREYQWTSSADQRAAHRLTLISVALLSVISFWLARCKAIEIWHRKILPHAGIGECLVAVALVLVAYGFLLPLQNVLSAGSIAAVFIVFVIFAPDIGKRRTERTLMAAIVLYLLALVVPGLLVQPIPLLADPPSFVVQLEMHLSAVTMQGRSIATGVGYDRLPSGYGYLMPSVMAVIEHITPTFTIGHQLRFVQICQLLFCMTATAAYWCYRPRAHLGIVAAMLVAGPYWTTAGHGIWIQNQTGFRSLGLPLGLLALALVGRMPLPRAAWWLGAVAAIALLNNPETAIAVSLGYVVYLVARTRQIPFGLYLRMAAAGLLTIVVWLGAYRLALGHLPFSGNIGELLFSFRTAARFASSDYGYRLFTFAVLKTNYVVVPFALMIFAHAIYVTIQSAARLGQGALNPRSSMRLAVTTITLVWFAYYINAPSLWQLWTLLFLYGFLVIDVLDRRRFAIGYPAPTDNRLITRLRHMRIAPAHFVFTLLLAMMLAITNGDLVKYMSEFRHPRWLDARQEKTLVSDVLMPESIGNALLKKAAALKRLYASADGSLVYLTYNTAFMPELTGIFQRDPYENMWIRVPGEAAFALTMENLLKARPKVILIDASEGPLAVSGTRLDYQNRIRSAVGRGYRNTGTEDGWEIWRPLDPSKAVPGAAS